MLTADRRAVLARYSELQVAASAYSDPAQASAEKTVVALWHLCISRRMGTCSTGSWSGLADCFKESGLGCRVKACIAGGGLSHALSGQLEPVGVAHEAIKDGAGQGWVASGVVLVLDHQLACDDCRGAAVADFEDFQGVMALGDDQDDEAPIKRPRNRPVAQTLRILQTRQIPYSARRQSLRGHLRS